MSKTREAKRRLYYIKKTTIVRVNDLQTMCAGCDQGVSKDWTYCPWCGAQERHDEERQS